MGVVNVTPDSFSDAGRFFDASRAIEQGLELRDEGADVVDVGGESTRPGAQPVSAHEELRRVIPVVQALAKEGVAVSVDTMKAEVMRAAIEAGSSFLLERAQALEDAGVARGRIVLDPGFGFGKTVEHNKQLFRALPQLAAHGYPVLAGVSRKKMIGDFTGRPAGERTAGSIAAALLAVQNGASLVRVHDVRETVDAIKVWMELT